MPDTLDFRFIAPIAGYARVRQAGSSNANGSLKHQSDFREMCRVLQVPDGEELMCRVVRSPRLWGGHALAAALVTCVNS